MKRSHYYAKRISANAPQNEILPISSTMQVDDIHKCYIEKCVEFDHHISHGPWILRPIIKEGTFHQNNFPDDILPLHIWRMVKYKIEISHALIAVIDLKSFGTIAEAGYAAGLGTVAVYILPDKKLIKEDIKDLWLIFQLSLQTKHLWEEEDIANASLFLEYGIKNIKEYEDFILKIIPNFLSKK